MVPFKDFVLDEDLRQWFKDRWVRMDTEGNIKGDCAREPGEGKPKCLPIAKARAMPKQDRATATISKELSCTVLTNLQQQQQQQQQHFGGCIPLPKTTPSKVRATFIHRTTTTKSTTAQIYYCTLHW